MLRLQTLAEMSRVALCDAGCNLGGLQEAVGLLTSLQTELKATVAPTEDN